MEREKAAELVAAVESVDERPDPRADGVRESSAHRRQQVLGASPPRHLLVVTFRC